MTIVLTDLTGNALKADSASPQMIASMKLPKVVEITPLESASSRNTWNDWWRLIGYFEVLLTATMKL